MKLSIALFPAFVVLIQASPTGKASFSIDIKVDDGFQAHKQAGINQICQAVCYFQEPSCGEQWYSEKYGEECWTCCLKEQELIRTIDVPLVSGKELAKLEVNHELQTHITHKDISTEQEICWLLCAAPDLQCPEDWVNVPLISGNELAKLKVNHELQTYNTQKLIGTKQGICWLLCASEPVKCPEGWDSKEFGDCWTCCKDTEDLVGEEDVPLISGKELAKFNVNHGLQTHITPKQIGIKQGICWLLCASEPVNCPEGWVSTYVSTFHYVQAKVRTSILSNMA
ncbi:MAG: hypothetical protein LQ351_005593 [Letrouitia transgressa]|nr:MAG: hypothetical protein LQ351_005593 [Letrouitia transgressa]